MITANGDIAEWMGMFGWEKDVQNKRWIKKIVVQVSDNLLYATVVGGGHKWKEILEEAAARIAGPDQVKLDRLAVSHYQQGERIKSLEDDNELLRRNAAWHETAMDAVRELVESHHGGETYPEKDCDDTIYVNKTPFDRLKKLLEARDGDEV